MTADSHSEASSSPLANSNSAVSPKRALLTLVCAGLFASLLAMVAFGLAGKFGVEKTVTKLVMPVGLIWLGLSGILIERIIRVRLRAWPIAALWALFTIAGTTPLGDACMRYLETRETVFRPEVDPALDLLVVLGGGTSQGPIRAQAGCSGDRVVLAAELHLQGHAKRLITTGESAPGLTGDRASPQEHTIEIWTALGIEPDSIGAIGGLNTYEEIQNLKELLKDGKDRRVGLLTSAYHLPRAMRLARAQGLSQLIPVAADYQSNSESYSFTDFIPSAGAFAQLSKCQHELMAALVGR